MDTIELIEDYLKGRLKGQELENFEVRMASDPAFAQEVEDHRAMQEMIFTQGLLETREKLQAIRKVRQEQGGN
jgi:anti-sigma factor RsiW